MMNKILLLMSFICSGILCHAQKDNKIYYDSLDTNLSNPADAYYFHYPPDSSKDEVKITYYYLDGKIYAKGKCTWTRESSYPVYLTRTGKWVYFYPNGKKKQIFYNEKEKCFWYENGQAAYRSFEVFSFRFHDWYMKNKYWYSTGQLRYVGMQKPESIDLYGYERYYRKNGTCWLKEYYVEGDLQGVSTYIDTTGNVKYFITMDEMSFWHETLNTQIVQDTTREPEFIEAKEGYNELIYCLDTFRFTLKNGQMEGIYYYGRGIENRRLSQGFYHHNYKTGNWKSISQGNKDALIYHYEHFKKGYLHGKISLLWNDSIPLMKGQYRYDKRVGKWLIADGATSDPRVMGDKDSLYFREEKFRHDTESKYYQNTYAAKRSDFSIKYLWITSRKNFLTNRIITIEYYPNRRVKLRNSKNERKEYAIQKLYDESGKFVEKKRISYQREPMF